MIPRINLQRFKSWAVEQLFYEMFPLLARYFMGKDDCRLTHQEGNIMAPTTGGPVTYTFFRGGHSTICDIQRPIFEARARLGDASIETIEETGQPGQFTG